MPAPSYLAVPFVAASVGGPEFDGDVAEGVAAACELRDEGLEVAVGGVVDGIFFQYLFSVLGIIGEGDMVDCNVDELVLRFWC